MCNALNNDEEKIMDFARRTRQAKIAVKERAESRAKRKILDRRMNLLQKKSTVFLLQAMHRQEEMSMSRIAIAKAAAEAEKSPPPDTVSDDSSLLTDFDI